MQLFLLFLTLCSIFIIFKYKVLVILSKIVCDNSYFSITIRKPTVTALNSGP